MNSFLLIEKQIHKQKEQAWSFCLEKGVDPLDITLIQTQTEEKGGADEKTPTKLKGIALIRERYKTIALKPIRSQNKALIIVQADTLSIPAQNALLKTIEDPPQNTYVVLTTENQHLLLPTILSRCSVIHSHVNQTADILEKDTLFPEERTLGAALTYAQKLSKDKMKALQTIEGHITTLHTHLQDAVSQNEREKAAVYQKRLTQYLQTYTHIKSTNINLRFALENLFLSNISAE